MHLIILAATAPHVYELPVRLAIVLFMKWSAESAPISGIPRCAQGLTS